MARSHRRRPDDARLPASARLLGPALRARGSRRRRQAQDARPGRALPRGAGPAHDPPVVSRPHALVLTPRMPWPLDDGGRIGLWQSLWTVSREYDTTLVSLLPPAEASHPLPPALAAMGV